MNYYCRIYCNIMTLIFIKCYKLYLYHISTLSLYYFLMASLVVLKKSLRNRQQVTIFLWILRLDKENYVVTGL